MSLENVYPTQPTTVTSEPAFEFQAFGTVVDDQEATMHSLPHTEATIRAHLPANGTFAIVARDQPGNWLEVVYASTTGELRHGWLKAVCARQVEKEGRAVRLLDIRISQFENNSRDDLAELIRRKSGRVKGFLLLLTVVGLLACLGGAGVGFGGGQPAVGAAWGGRGTFAAGSYREFGARPCPPKSR